MRRRRLWLVSAVAVCIAAAAARADVIYKKDGGKIVGTVNHDQSSETHLVIKTRAGILKIPREQVKAVQRDDEHGEQYSQAVKKFRDTPDEQLALAIWCQQNGFTKEYLRHLNRVIELDPDHGETRRRLGYQKFDGEWKTRDEILTEQGYVKYRGRYVLSQEKEEFERRAEQTRAEREYFQTIKGLRTRLKDEDPRRREAAERELEAIVEPAAIKAVFDLLWKRGDESERQFAVGTLARIDDPDSTARLLEVAMEDKSAELRSAAADALKPRKSPTLVRDAVKGLRHPENQKVRNAAVVLEAIGDSSIVSELVAALVTKHTHVVQEPLIDRVRRATTGSIFRPGVTLVDPKTGTTLNPRQVNSIRPGGAGLGFGQSDKQIVVEERRNPEVLAALRTLTDQDFGYDKDRWQRWIRDNYREKSAKLKY